MKLKKILKSLSLTLILAFSIALIPTQKAHAGTWISSDAAYPTTCVSNWQSTKVALPTLDVDCYVLYTTIESDEPSQDQMWRIPAGQPNVQDFNICGTWWLHVYVPDTGQRVTFGPYSKDDQAPPVPSFYCNPSIQVGQWNDTLSSVTVTSISYGDNGATGHDNINNCDSTWTAGFKKLEVWDTWNGVDTQITVSDYQTYYDLLVNKPGWHKIWARTYDDVDNYSNWSTIEFGLGPSTGTPPPGGEPGGGSTSSVGTIKFDPNETKWTNKGKSDEGEGAYPVKVYYDGDNPYKTTGTAHIEKEVESTDAEGNTTTHTVKSTESITVEFPLESIDVTGAADDTVDGDSGTINIEQEGYQLNLHGVGHWGSAEYDEPDDCVGVDYDTPADPVGDSKFYNLDWTKPEIDFNIKDKIFSEAHGAVRKSSILGSDDSFYGTLTEQDNLSGAKSIDYKWTYGSTKPNSGYTNIYTSADTNTNKSSEVIKKEIEKPVGDDLYLHVKVVDIAGNDTYERFGPYEDPIKLKDFEVTDIRDPRWHDVFWNDDSYNDYKNVTFKANQLPIDEASHPTIRNAYPKKGYAFYWDITSEYLYRQNDRIEVRPTFYYLQGANRIRVDAYFNNNNNPLVKFGTSLDDSKMYLDTDAYGKVLIGNYSKLILTRGVRIPKGREWIDGWKDEIQYTDGKLQWWYGKYYIPSSAFFVKTGDSPRPENKLTNGKILINFEIIAYKNGVETFSTSQIFNYTTSQWEEEGGPKNSDYYIGDTIVMNAKYGADSDKGISVIH